MQNVSFKRTKIKLTVIFTLLVFAIAVLLEGLFFTFKYYNYTFTEENSFEILTSKVENKFISIKDVIVAYDIGKKIFKMGQGKEVVKSDDVNMVNLIIVDKDKMELLFSNVTDNISVSFVEKILNEYKYGIINQERGFLIKKILINENGNNYDVLFIKNLRYGFGDYLEDLFGIIFITFLSSVLFYYIGLLFVTKNLKPVEDNLTDMHDFIHNAGHELKTPISVIHSNLQLIKATKKYDEGLIQEGMSEINRLNNLIESLIELSNIHSTETREKIEIKSEIMGIVNDFSSKAQKKDINITIRLRKIQEKFLVVNKQYFYILFSNLLGNAIKYTNNGGNIDITISKDRVYIKDTGIGISKDNIKKIFDRFYMVENARNIEEGYGIGLSLVKKIADIYKWKIKVKSEEGKGTEFILEF